LSSIFGIKIRSISILNYIMIQNFNHFSILFSLEKEFTDAFAFLCRNNKVIVIYHSFKCLEVLQKFGFRLTNCCIYILYYLHLVLFHNQRNNRIPEDNASKITIAKPSYLLVKRRTKIYQRHRQLSLYIERS
jgi:hypothetical protein